MYRFETTNALIKLVNALVVALLTYAQERQRIYYASINHSYNYKAPKLEDPLKVVKTEPTYPPAELSDEQENM